MWFLLKKRAWLLSILWPLVLCSSEGQDSTARQEGAPTSYFKNCTPGSLEATGCATLEKFWAPRLAELGESPLSDLSDAQTVAVYRFSTFGFVTDVPIRTARVILRSDGSIDTAAARKWSDGRIERSQRHLNVNDGSVLLSLLDWGRFASMNTKPTLTDRATVAGDKRTRIEYRDGGVYLLEGVRSGNYHVIQRSTFHGLAPNDFSWVMMSGLEREFRQLGVWTSGAALSGR
jgi:hypothetical protein